MDKLVIKIFYVSKLNYTLKAFNKERAVNLEKQKEMVNKNNKWIENFKSHKNITKLDRDVITELIDYIEVHERKK